jgi:UDP-N-acetylglucosamine 4-epimerase
MSRNKFHHGDLSPYRFLVTGGAGFIGSNIVAYLVKHHAGHVRILDNLSNGSYRNIEEFTIFPQVEFIHGDIRDLDTCKHAVSGMDFVSHQAALGSVPRSIDDPLTTNAVNITGFLNMLVACKQEKGLKRLVYAASSSTYGDLDELPKVEERVGKPISPYAVTKAVNEMYAEVFSRLHGFHSIGLRYFNVFGPKQKQDGPYAAVIPIFCRHFIEGTAPTIFGDGHTSRDFTFVENAVQANIRSLLHGLKSESKSNGNIIYKHEVFNVACGEQISLNEMVKSLCEITGKQIAATYGPERAGDVKHSKADIEKIERILGYSPDYTFKEGLSIVYDHYKKEMYLNDKKMYHARLQVAKKRKLHVAT